jgi:hypothetical protein
MTKEEIISYKVIPASRKAKKNFDKRLPKYMLLGTFKNEFHELFVMYRWSTECLGGYGTLITGDELAWEEGWHVDRLGNVLQPFGVSEEERVKILEILKGSKNEER